MTLVEYFVESAGARGFKQEVPAGAESLASASDVFLSRRRGAEAKFACIIDGVRPQRRFSLTLAQVVREARRAHAAGPLYVEIFDVGGDLSRRRWLKGHHSGPANGADVVAWVFGADGALWTNAAWLGIFRGRGFFRRVIGEFRRRPR